jgi:hypothetical protein
MALFAISYALTYSTVNTNASSRLSSSPKQETVSGILALSAVRSETGSGQPAFTGCLRSGSAHQKMHGGFLHSHVLRLISTCESMSAIFTPRVKINTSEKVAYLRS